MKKKWLACMLIVGLLVMPLAAKSATVPVFDLAAFGQMLLEAVWWLEDLALQAEQVANQVLQYEMLVAQYENLVINTLSLGVSLVNNLMHPLAHINAMIDHVEGIPHKFEQVTERFDQIYPPFEQGFWDGGTMVGQLKAFSRQMRAAGRVAMQTHSVVEAIAGDQLTLQTTVRQSDGAVGHLQAIQAGNNIAALNTVQLIRMEQMLAAQGRQDTSRDMADAALKDQVMMRMDFVMEGWTTWTQEPGVASLPTSFR